MAGQVFVFNCFNEPDNMFSVGGFNAAPIPPWGNTGASQYQPQSLPVPRIKHPDERKNAAFAYGSNACQVIWDSFTVTMTVIVPTDGLSLDDDLILYVCADQSILLNDRGYVLGAFRNTPVSAEAAAEAKAKLKGHGKR